MQITPPDPDDDIDAHLRAIRVHLVHLRRSVGILAWLAVVGTAMSIVAVLTAGGG